MKRQFSYDLDDADPDGVCASQTTAGAGNLTLNGVYVSGGVATLDVGRRLAFASTGNYSAVNFTITGTDPDGVAQTETLLGADNDVAESVKYWKTISNIAADAALATAITVGTVDEICTPTFPVDSWSTEQASLSVKVTGTINYTIQDTPDPVNEAGNLPHQNAVWQDITALADKTGDLHAKASDGARAVRMVVNSYTNGAEIRLGVYQPSGV